MPRDDWQFKKSVNNCTLEDFQGTYRNLQLIGPEEIRRRLQTVDKLKQVIKEFTEGMGSDGVVNKATKAAKQCKNSICEQERKDFLVLPKLCPEIYQRSRLTGFTELGENRLAERSDDKEKSLGLKTENTKLRKRKKRGKRKESSSSICLDCQVGTITDKTWLPQLSEAGRREKRSSKKEESFVLPEIRVVKNR